MPVQATRRSHHTTTRRCRRARARIGWTLALAFLPAPALVVALATPASASASADDADVRREILRHTSPVTPRTEVDPVGGERTGHTPGPETVGPGTFGAAPPGTAEAESRRRPQGSPSLVLRVPLRETPTRLHLVGDHVLAELFDELVLLDRTGAIVARRSGEFRDVIVADDGIVAASDGGTVEFDPRTLRTVRTYAGLSGAVQFVGDAIVFQESSEWTVVDRSTGARRTVFDPAFRNIIHAAQVPGPLVLVGTGLELSLVAIDGPEPVTVATAPGDVVHVGDDGTVFAIGPAAPNVLERRDGTTLELIDRTTFARPIPRGGPTIEWAADAEVMVVGSGLTAANVVSLWRPGGTSALATIPLSVHSVLILPDASLAVAPGEQSVEFHTFAPRIGATSTPIVEPRWAPAIAVSGTGLDAVDRVLVDGRPASWHRDREGRVVVDVGDNAGGGPERIELTSAFGSDRVDLAGALPRGESVVSLRASPAPGAPQRIVSWQLACGAGPGRPLSTGTLVDDVAEIIPVPAHARCNVTFGVAARGLVRSGFLDVDAAGLLVDVGDRSISFRAGAPVHVGVVHGNAVTERPLWVLVDGVGGPAPSTRYTLAVRCGRWSTRVASHPGAVHRLMVRAPAGSSCRASLATKGRARVVLAGRVETETGEVTGGRGGVSRFRLGQVSGSGYVSFVVDHGRSDAAAPLAIGAPGEAVGRASDAGVVHLFPARFGGAPDPGASRILRPGDGLPGRPVRGERVGAALADGDFDGDGFVDLAIGAPGSRIGRHARAGKVYVAFGGPGGPGSGRTFVVHEGQSGIPGEPGRGHGFGSSLAVADFDGDGRDDLVVGVPGARIAGVAGAGRVVVIEGGLDGSGATETQVLTQQLVRGERPGRGDAFGAAVDGFERYIVVGAPGESRQRATGAGTVHLFDGFELRARRLGRLPRPAAGDALGSSVAITDQEVFAGAPGRDIAGARDVGGIYQAELPGGRGAFRLPDRFGAPIVAGFGEATALMRVLLSRGWVVMVGAPGDATPGAAEAGSVSFMGVHAAQGWIDRTSAAVPGAPARGDRFGATLGFGLRGQLVVGAPGAGPSGSGVVFVGSADERWAELHQDVPGVDGRARRGNEFGAAIAG